jgi:hypothetical protein
LWAFLCGQAEQAAYAASLIRDVGELQRNLLEYEQAKAQVAAAAAPADTGSSSSSSSSAEKPAAAAAEIEAACVLAAVRLAVSSDMLQLALNLLQQLRQLGKAAAGCSSTGSSSSSSNVGAGAAAQPPNAASVLDASTRDCIDKVFSDLACHVLVPAASAVQAALLQAGKLQCRALCPQAGQLFMIQLVRQLLGCVLFGSSRRLLCAQHLRSISEQTSASHHWCLRHT